MAPLLARYLVPYLVPSDGAPAHDRRWLYSKICARCVGRGVVCWRLMAAIAMGRFRFTRRGGGFPRRATDSGASAAAGRRRARGCARTVRAPARLPAVSYHCGTNNLLVPFIAITLYGGGLTFGTLWSGLSLCSFRSFSAGVRGGLSCARRCSAVMRTWVCRDDVRSRPPVLRCRDPCGTVSYVRMFGRGVLVWRSRQTSLERLRINAADV